MAEKYWRSDSIHALTEPSPKIRKMITLPETNSKRPEENRPSKATILFPNHPFLWVLLLAVSFKGEVPSLKTNSSPLKIGRNPIGKDRIPTIHFQVLLLAEKLELPKVQIFLLSRPRFQVSKIPWVR